MIEDEGPEAAFARAMEDEQKANLEKARSWGKEGGLKRASKLTKKRRSEIARQAAKARWSK